MAVDVRIESVAPGACAWCGREQKEVASVAFADRSFVGPMCWRDLQRALRMKCQAGNAAPTPPAATPGRGAATD